MRMDCVDMACLESRGDIRRIFHVVKEWKGYLKEKRKVLNTVGLINRQEVWEILPDEKRDQFRLQEQKQCLKTHDRVLQGGIAKQGVNITDKAVRHFGFSIVVVYTKSHFIFNGHFKNR